jgi:hypothetical protein
VLVQLCGIPMPIADGLAEYAAEPTAAQKTAGSTEKTRKYGNSSLIHYSLQKVAAMQKHSSLQVKAFNVKSDISH